MRMKTHCTAPRPISLREVFAWADEDDAAFAPPKPQPEKPETTMFYTELSAALKSLAPEGSAVFAIGFDDTTELLRAGYKLADSCETAFLTVARGGTAEFEQAKRTATDRLVLCPIRDYCSVATEYYRAHDKAFAVTKVGKKPDAAVFDSRLIDSPASVFGELAALELCAFDYMFGAVLRGESCDRTLSAAVAELVAELTAALKGKEKDDAHVRSALITACQTAARLIEKTPALLGCSGATQTYEALRMLCTHESRSVPPRGDAEMLLAVSLTDFYIKNAAAEKPLFPPNNGKRIDSVCEYLGADLIRATVYVSPVYPPKKLKLCEYRCREFGREQLQMLCDMRGRLANAFSVFKRLFPDDGYALKNMIPAEDIGICIALAPDVFAADSMLSYFKQTGLLEKLIV